MKLRLFFAWYDLWVGAYWDRKARVLYVCPLPCVVLCAGPFERSPERRSERACCRAIDLSGRMTKADLHQMADYFASAERARP